MKKNFNSVIARQPRRGNEAISGGSADTTMVLLFRRLLRQSLRSFLAMTPLFYILHFTFYILPIFSGCYSFTGASLPAGIKSIAIPLVTDNSNFAQADIRQQLTEGLVQTFTRDGSLQVRDRTASDALLDVTITSI